VLIATQLNSTELNLTAWTTVDSVCRSWRHKQKHDWLGCTLFNWVSWVGLSCVAINTPKLIIQKSILQIEGITGGEQEGDNTLCIFKNVEAGFIRLKIDSPACWLCYSRDIDIVQLTYIASTVTELFLTLKSPTHLLTYLLTYLLMIPCPVGPVCPLDFACTHYCSVTRCRWCKPCNERKGLNCFYQALRPIDQV